MRTRRKDARELDNDELDELKEMWNDETRFYTPKQMANELGCDPGIIVWGLRALKRFNKIPHTQPYKGKEIKVTTPNRTMNNLLRDGKPQQPIPAAPPRAATPAPTEPPAPPPPPPKAARKSRLIIDLDDMKFSQAREICELLDTFGVPYLMD